MHIHSRRSRARRPINERGRTEEEEERKNKNYCVSHDQNWVSRRSFSLISVWLSLCFVLHLVSTWAGLRRSHTPHVFFLFPANCYDLNLHIRKMMFEVALKRMCCVSIFLHMFREQRYPSSEESKGLSLYLMHDQDSNGCFCFDTFAPATWIHVYVVSHGCATTETPRKAVTVQHLAKLRLMDCFICSFNKVHPDFHYDTNGDGGKLLILLLPSPKDTGLFAVINV